MVHYGTVYGPFLPDFFACFFGQFIQSTLPLKQYNIDFGIFCGIRTSPYLFRLKINMEPTGTNHPFRKENDLPNLHDYVPCYASGV